MGCWQDDCKLPPTLEVHGASVESPGSQVFLQPSCAVHVGHIAAAYLAGGDRETVTVQRAGEA